MTTLPATEPALQRAEARRTADRRTADLTAYDLYLRALAIYFPITKQRVLEALGHLEQAIAIDRQFGAALGERKPALRRRPRSSKSDGSRDSEPGSRNLIMQFVGKTVFVTAAQQGRNPSSPARVILPSLSLPAVE